MKNVFCAYKEVWVIHQYGDTDISKVYTDKDQAIIDCHKQNEEYKKNFKQEGKYKVLTLNDALDQIKERVEEGDPYQEDY